MGVRKLSTGWQVPLELPRCGRSKLASARSPAKGAPRSRFLCFYLEAKPLCLRNHLSELVVGHPYLPNQLLGRNQGLFGPLKARTEQTIATRYLNVSSDTNIFVQCAN